MYKLYLGLIGIFFYLIFISSVNYLVTKELLTLQKEVVTLNGKLDLLLKNQLIFVKNEIAGEVSSSYFYGFDLLEVQVIGVVTVSFVILLCILFGSGGGGAAASSISTQIPTVCEYLPACVSSQKVGNCTLLSDANDNVVSIVFKDTANRDICFTLIEDFISIHCYDETSNVDPRSIDLGTVFEVFNNGFFQ